MSITCWRYAGLFLLTGLGGMLSGCMWMVPNGLMAGALGLSLSCGTLWLGIQQARGGAGPTRRYALVTGGIVGLLGGISMALISAACSGMRRQEFGPPSLPVWAPLVMGVLYGIVLSGCYHRRLASKHPLRSVLFEACALCFLFKAGGTFIYLVATDGPNADFTSLATGALLLSLLGAVPFAFLWVVATALLDPMWSPRGRQELAQPVSLPASHTEDCS